METIIFMLIGIVIGIAIGWLLSKWQNAGRIGAFYAKYNELDKRCAIAIADKERIEQQAAIDKKEMQERLAAAQEEHVRQMADNNKVLEQQMKMMEERLKNATTELLKLRSQELQETNSTQMSAIINPLKESIGEMKQAMDNTREQGTKNTASLEKAIENMINRAAEIGNKADNLANALKNENKMQGNWGEMILSELLESEGLKRGVHYSVQETLRDEHGNALRNDETGQKMIPDVILHFPDNRDAIIDSKTSLTAFIDYQNAESDEARNDALSRHVQSLRSHVRELANKNYKAYIKPPKQTLNYVIMFVPNETALQLALLNDAGLWREAYDKGVFITGEQNLLAVLRLIEVAWVQQEQTRNQEEILKQARLLLDRVGTFMEHFRDVAQKLDAAQESYQKAKDKLITGKQNILGPAKKLADMSGQENPKRRIGILEEE
ncbi:MAG: DNA recombination protein RmuC [Prevotella sp.]|nr:DNA recombination protein RmuC [Prevotella sp.]